MTTELLSVLVTVIAVGVALGGVILTGLHGIRREMGDLRGEMGDLRGEIGGVRGELNELRRDMETRLSAVDAQQAKLEGLREAITGHRAA